MARSKFHMQLQAGRQGEEKGAVALTGRLQLRKTIQAHHYRSAY